MKFRTLLCLLLSTAFALSCDKISTNGTALPVYENLQSRSSKRGVSYSFPEYDIPLLAPGVSWSYNWSGNIPADRIQELFDEYDMEFIQMIWNGNYNKANFRNYKAAHPEAEYILAFNEPNLTDQARMTPQEAAALWPAVRELAQELGMKLISPAMNYGTLENYNDPWKWLDEFFACDGVSLDDVDGIAIHCYMGNVTAVKEYISKFKKYGKPIWLTEFCNWDNNNISLENQMQYMVEIINYLESDDDVARYAWFIPRDYAVARKVNNNLLTFGQAPYYLSDLGKVFVNLSTQDKALYYTQEQIVPFEHYSSCSSGILVRPVSDETGLLELYNLNRDFWTEYLIEVQEDGEHEVEIRYKSHLDMKVELSVDGAESVELTLASSDKLWTTAVHRVELPAGKHVLRFTGKDFASPTYNWFRIRNVNL